MYDGVRGTKKKQKQKTKKNILFYVGVRGTNIYIMVLCACKGIHGAI